MTSFLLSLFLINRSSRLRRYTSSSTTSTPSSFLARLTTTLNPEPYQDATKTTWDRRDSASHVSPHSAISPRQTQHPDAQKRGSWYLHKKISKVARLEIGDALDMSTRVLAVMVGGVVVLGFLAWVGVSWVVGLVSR
jgi:hypothetical protein